MMQLRLCAHVGQQQPPIKHFTLKRKPKSAALRAELLQKSADAASSVKKVSAPTVPVRSRGMPRKMTDTTPLKGIPSRVPTGGFRSPPTNSPSASRPPMVRNAGRKDGGIKLLDITEQPLGYAAAKKRKRMQELEEQKKASELAAAAQAAASVADSTPDYAAGLTSTVVFTQPATTPGMTVKEPTTPSSSSSNTTSSTSGTSSTGSSTSTTTDTSTPSSYNPNGTPNRTPFTGESPLAHSNMGQTQQTIILTPSSIRPPNLSEDSASPSTPVNEMRHKVIVASPLAKGKTQTVILANSGVLQKNVLLGVQKGHQLVSNLQTGLNNSTNVPGISSLQNNSNPPGLTPTNMPRVVKLPNQQAQPAQRKGLSLTKPQMLEAQEMFSKANKVTRPEKALILGFMAGSRDNPCPDLGNIVTIKLSEILENVLQEDDTYKAMLVETHFQMNYENGEWERIKKYRRIDTNDAKVVHQGQGESIAL
ncbi:negative elongation factor A-like [Ctenocephalides felis]|uniref:negative elongation factor A-like n=1 Tax=Ctenocephalides felis TaxID=7515 RepID=UPI000E6E5095|nr:negative elongation factor A-like [Ctenocephalides felis]